MLNVKNVMSYNVKTHYLTLPYLYSIIKKLVLLFHFSLFHLLCFVLYTVCAVLALSTAYFHPKYRNTTLLVPAATVINFHVKLLHLTKAISFIVFYIVTSFTFTD